MVESINEYMISLNQSSKKSYLSSDTIYNFDNTYLALEHVHTPEFLNTIKCSGVPNHALTLKVGIPVMLLRNIDQSAGLYHGTRLIITKLGNHVIEAKVLAGQMVGQKVFTPSMTLTPSDARIPFKFQRRQFPIIVSFAMTVNKSQGLSLSHVGLFLKKSIFTHGQLYVALSQVTSRRGLKILVYDDDVQITIEATNVVFKEIFPSRNHGDGKQVDLKECPRSKLQKQCIKYLGPEEREHYKYIVAKGKIVPKHTGNRLDTTNGLPEEK
ncbi:PREDICTED: ATP-dependent DNA helicase PIF1-like [Nicotiana attenuata]|uniref:ATP-dependent DNA helicase PIF1-like n=1 Tax=Nicotiana attenuata TaxID=49451 RepID=UPI000904C1EA|nr:PREDICTED: ATP-dependent DNA helicase PIF1-like [Nicotiana attenuata]